jgi:hypothetical protein
MLNSRPDPLTQTTLDTLRRFNDAFNRQDIAAVMAEMDEDCVFENTYPPPDGERSGGFAAVQATFGAFFASSPQAFFEFEEIFAFGERAFQRWTYRWVDARGVPGHVRGVDILRVRGGKILEKFSYVKG